MSESPLAIVGLGLVTPSGLTAKETAANTRASQSRAALKPLLGRRYGAFTVATLSDAVLPPLPGLLPPRPFRAAREERMLRLATLGLAGYRKPTAYDKPVPLLLALPEHETNIPLSPDKFLDDLHAINPGAFNRSLSRAEWRGRAGGLAAFAAAFEMLAAKQTECVLVGGVDSFLSTWILGQLDLAGRAKSEDHSDSFVPGEGAGFVLVATHEVAQKANWEILAGLSLPGVGYESGHWASEEPYKGEGLCTAFQNLREIASPTQLFAEVYSTMNGESYWAKEWGMARVRHAQAFAEHARLHHPFEFTGDLGAASGPLLIGLAVEGIRNQYRQSPALIYASSDYGSRAASYVSAQPLTSA